MLAVMQPDETSQNPYVCNELTPLLDTNRPRLQLKLLITFLFSPFNAQSWSALQSQMLRRLSHGYNNNAPDPWLQQIPAVDGG